MKLQWQTVPIYEDKILTNKIQAVDFISDKKRAEKQVAFRLVLFSSLITVE